MTDLFFPSKEHQAALAVRVEAGGLDDIELREFHGYRYAWRRVRLADFTQRYSGDPEGKWFDGYFVNQAVEFYTGGKYRLGPRRSAPLGPENRAEPTADEIAHVERCCATIRANLAKAEERNRAAFGERDAEAEEGCAALRRVRDELGFCATETQPAPPEQGEPAAAAAAYDPVFEPA